MPIVQWGKTPCAICGRPVLQEEDSVSTPAFLRESHPLWHYSDALFHKKCYEVSSDKLAVDSLLARYKEVMSQAPKTFEAYEEWVTQAMKEFG